MPKLTPPKTKPFAFLSNFSKISTKAKILLGLGVLLGIILLYFCLTHLFFKPKPPTYEDLIPEMETARQYHEQMAELVHSYDGTEKQIGTPAYNGYLGIIDETTPKPVVEYTKQKYQGAIDETKTILQEVQENEAYIAEHKGIVSLADLEKVRVSSPRLTPIRPLDQDQTYSYNAMLDRLAGGHTTDNPHDHDHDHDHDHNHNHFH